MLAVQVSACVTAHHKCITTQDRKGLFGAPLSRHAVDKPVDSVARDAPLREHLLCNLRVQRLQRCQRIALHLRA